MCRFHLKQIIDKCTFLQVFFISEKNVPATSPSIFPLVIEAVYRYLLNYSLENHAADITGLSISPPCFEEHHVDTRNVE